ncbi:MAG: NAD-dependent epimerase/dehydratase family protein [Bryobacteraceae bacterium]
MRRVVWITGAGGFSATYLARYLRELSEDLELIGLDSARQAPSSLFDLFHLIDLRNQEAISELAQSQPPDRVFHLAGRMPPAPEEELWSANVSATLALLQAVARRSKKELRILSIGSAAEYLPASDKLSENHPCGGTTPYGRTKWAQTVLALASGRELNLRVLVARTFNLLGPGLSPHLVAGSLCAQISKGPRKTIEVGDLQPKRDFVDIRDAVAAYWCVLERGEPGQIYNVSSGRTTSIRTLARSFVSLSGFCGTLRENPSRIRRGEIDRSCGDNTKLRGLGWEPSISLRQSLSDMLNRARTG